MQPNPCLIAAMEETARNEERDRLKFMQRADLVERLIDAEAALRNRRIVVSGESNRLLNRKAIEFDVHQRGEPESGSGAAELEVEFEDGVTLLVYVHDDGTLHVEVD